MGARASTLRGKAGFTLLEAMLVLAVTGLTLGLVFSVTSRSMVTGYRLGGRAIGVAERQLSIASYRTVVSSFVVPVLTTRAMTDGGLEVDSTLTAFVGEPRQVSGDWIANRGGPCGPAGTYGRLTLSLTAQNGGAALTCQFDGGEPMPVMTLAARDAQFQYSEDGAEWLPSWTVEAGQYIEMSADPGSEARKVYVRLVAEDGSTDLMGIATTDHPTNAAGQLPVG